MCVCLRDLFTYDCDVFNPKYVCQYQSGLFNMFSVLDFHFPFIHCSIERHHIAKGSKNYKDIMIMSFDYTLLICIAALSFFPPPSRGELYLPA